MTNKNLILAPVDNTNEIFQALDIKFSLLDVVDDTTYKQCHTPIKCRDFLGDCIWSRDTQQDVHVYRFRYNYLTNPFNQDKLLLSLKFPTKVSMKYFFNNFSKLNDIEEQANVTKSIIHTTEEKNTVILESDKVWHSCVWKLSLFTFFVKIISYKDETQLGNPENDYITYLTDDIKNKLLSKVATEFTQVLPTYITEAHNSSGFISIIKNYNKDMHNLLLGAK